MKTSNPIGLTVLILALISTGLLAGTYYAYATSVMLALGKFDDKTFVDVMNKISVVIVNPLFMLSFLGSVGLSIAAALCYLRADLRPVLFWIGAAVLLNILSLVVSSAFNIPLNNHLATANDAAGAVDYAGLRKDFEMPWQVWNIVRGLINTAALATLSMALVQHGRLLR
ncbi:DUF1772 domain-containing protein [Nocardia arthritidis]|uniref:DUF1772 domain-containing protein n=1 Tax=Nocardia arthritidis TaxID=228602 RepID=A0A6G9YID6_9NOCA|nr:anthrone oxygenase family protein [Nocardia arthritidis]QIS13065.1 DUF1772 domain-containing protein [Nocardia arthritidis]